MVMRHLFKKNKNLLVILSICAIGVLLVGYHCGFQKTCRVQKLDQAVRGEAVIQLPNGIVHAEVVDTPASRAQGLSGRSGLGEKEGMLFIFEHPGKYGFWMKDMLFPIDIVWISEEGYVVHVEHDISPSTYAVTNPPQTFINEPNAKYVLEIGAGQAAKLGAHLGTKVRIAR